MARDDPMMRIRLPQELKDFSEQQARRYGCSQNSVVVRAMREMQERDARRDLAAGAKGTQLVEGAESPV